MAFLTRRTALQLTPVLLAAQSRGFTKGIATVSFPKEMVFGERCRRARKNGFGAFEIRCIEDIAIPHSRSQCEEWKRTATNEGVRIATLWASGRLYADARCMILVRRDGKKAGTRWVLIRFS